MKISLVVPVYNEEKIIRETILSVKDYMEKNFADYEIIFVNDGSSDNTEKIASELSGGNLKLISYEQNKGKGGAVKTGMLAALGDVIFYTDADLAYGTGVILEGYKIFEEDKEADLVIGSRKKHKDGYESYTLIRKIMSFVFYLVLKIYGGLQQSDSQSGIKGFRSKAAKKIFGLCQTDGWSFDFEVLKLAEKLKYKTAEMPVKIINHRESKIKPGDSIKMLREISVIKKRIKNLNL